MEQIGLFEHIALTYVKAPDAPVSNDDLYQCLSDAAGIPLSEFEKKEAVGTAGKEYSTLKRKVRWHQQTMKQLGLIENQSRGAWRLTRKGKEMLTPAQPSVTMLGFSTNLGIAVWGACRDVFGRIDEPITLCVTSPPYLLKTPRAYGNPDNEVGYIDFICQSIEPIVKNLVPGGSVCLNISQDIFNQGLPSRSMYCERLLLAIHDRLGLHLMDRLVWESNKPPGPIAWASKQRVQLNVSYEIVYWMTNDPSCVRSDNRRVLQEHTEQQLRLIKGGGEQRDGSYSDGAYTIRKGKSFANHTAGKIPRNILKFSNNCADKRALAKTAKELGLPVHGATMPLALPKFLIEFLTGTGEEELVVDPFGGWFRTAKAAQSLGRRWMSSEMMGEYVLGGSKGFEGASGFRLGSAFAA